MDQAALVQFQKRNLQFEKSGTNTTVPDDDVAKLMYYLSCISCLADDCIPSNLTNYKQYYRLSSTERLQVIALALELEPDKVPIIIEVPRLPDNDGNIFVTLSSLEESVTALGIQANGAAMMALRREVGNRKEIGKVMFYTPGWIRNNYMNPIVSIRRELELRQMMQQLQRQQEAERRKRSGCVIQ